MNISRTLTIFVWYINELSLEVHCKIGSSSTRSHIIKLDLISVYEARVGPMELSLEQMELS